MKNTFFQKARYCDPKSYNEHYNNPICELENCQIQRAIELFIPEDVQITDIGCGTGLVKTLVHHPYIGIDISPENIAYCKTHYEGEFHAISAEEYIKRIDKLNPIFCFSLEYIDIDAIEQYIKKTERVLIAIHYNKPYLSPTSVYSGKKLLFDTLHPEKRRKEIQDLLDSYKAFSYALMGEEYYRISVIKRW